MSDHRYNYTSDDLSLTQANSYNLLLQIDANTFSYGIVFKKQLLAWGENYPVEELRDPQILRDILTANYKQVIIGLSSAVFTLMPGNLFDKNRVAAVARLLDVNHHEKVYWQQLTDDNVIIYKVDDSIASAITTLDNQTVNYSAKGWVTIVADSRPNDDEIYLNLSDEKVEVLYFNNRSLRFYNAYTFKNHEELAYYTALAVNEVKLQPHNVTLIISGDINATDRNFTYLAGFFNKVSLNQLAILTLPEQVQSHKVLTLAALTLCASSEEN
ncbi:DUF3822 family protein [Inquilinus sp. KBS0705]|nr:DUF3822 family protein [Inquilinus sp. KBS0705]